MSETIDRRPAEVQLLRESENIIKDLEQRIAAQRAFTNGVVSSAVRRAGLQGNPDLEIAPDFSHIIVTPTAEMGFVEASAEEIKQN